ncbi:MAG TPA: DUF305 domain-containing protein [Rubrobacteraceae bacterium]|nr:DUF305 domain-containing protein [Rubrobacteraceae bacterium]
MKGSLLQRAKLLREPLSRPRGLPQVPVLVAALLVGVVVGAVLALLFFARTPGDVPTALGAPGEDSAEVGFARDMVVHHAQAVQMAEIVRGKTESEEIRTLAANIALTQQAQIGQMQGWLQVWDLPPTGTEPAMSWMGHPTEGRMPGMAAPEELDRLQRASPEEADVLFLQLMIPHHEAALPMAEAVLEETDREEVQQLAAAVATSQEAEIRVLQELLQRHGVQAEEPSASDADLPSGQEHVHGGH